LRVNLFCSLYVITWIPTASTYINEDLLNDRTGLFPEEDREEVKEMVEFWDGRTYGDKCAQYMDRRQKVLTLMADYIQPGRDMISFD